MEIFPIDVVHSDGTTVKEDAKQEKEIILKGFFFQVFVVHQTLQKCSIEKA